jgi:hypothetical protein
MACRFVITKPRERGGHSPRWAAGPEKIIKIIIIITTMITNPSHHNSCNNHLTINASTSQLQVQTTTQSGYCYRKYILDAILGEELRRV